jgi:hypothetical protein
MPSRMSPARLSGSRRSGHEVQITAKINALNTCKDWRPEYFHAGLMEAEGRRRIAAYHNVDVKPLPVAQPQP